MFPSSLVLRVCAALLALFVPVTARAVVDAGGGASGGLYTEIVTQYLNGKWDEVNGEFTRDAKGIIALPAAQRADVEYIRRTIPECRPAWWQQCKAGQMVKFRPVVWGHAIAATYDPAAKGGLRIDYVNGVGSVVLNWNAADMDNPAVAGELEFNKGEQLDLDIWTNFGTAHSWAAIPPRAQLNMSEQEKVQRDRYLAFRGNITAAYYATPRARRLALWQAVSGWSHEYDKSQTVMSVRALGILFAAEVLGHPQTYPSVKWPEEPPADGAESKMIWALQEWIRHHELPLAEDKALREAIKAFATANEGKTRQTSKATLSNGLSLSLDPAEDQPFSVQRDAWLKAQYAKVAHHP
jgi:hypothetical protein